MWYKYTSEHSDKSCNSETRTTISLSSHEEALVKKDAIEAAIRHAADPGGLYSRNFEDSNNAVLRESFSDTPESTDAPSEQSVSENQRTNEEIMEEWRERFLQQHIQASFSSFTASTSSFTAYYGPLRKA